MSYQKVFNPLDMDVTTGYKGEYYTIKSKETKSLPEVVAEQFLEVYGFLENQGDAVTEVKSAAPEEAKTEVKKVVKK